MDFCRLTISVELEGRGFLNSGLGMRNGPVVTAQPVTRNPQPAAHLAAFGTAAAGGFLALDPGLDDI